MSSRKTVDGKTKMKVNPLAVSNLVWKKSDSHGGCLAGSNASSADVRIIIPPKNQTGQPHDESRYDEATTKDGAEKSDS